MAITRRELIRSAGLLAGASVLGSNGEASAKEALEADLFDLLDYERQAKASMAPMAWDYIDEGAGDELTLKWNRESYTKIRLRPRALVDVSKLDSKITLLGRQHACPILLAPTAYHKLTHPEGEIATVKGAGLADVTTVLSLFSTITMEEVAAAAKSPLWHQIYVQPDRGVTKELIHRIEAIGCEALVLTVDTPVLGARYREMRSKFTLPPGLERANLKGLPGASGAQRPKENDIYSVTLDPRLTWKEIDWIRSLTKMPVVLKGILNSDDADRAVSAGVAGIIVSNHGGRNMDTVPATIDALPEVTAKVAGRIPVLVDGGIRRGTDVLKAIALGASAVLIGRPYLHGLAVGGSEGVARIVQILRREFAMAMALSGRTTIAQIDSTVIWR